MIVPVILLCATPNHLEATPASFLYNSHGARSTSMGKAFTAISNAPDSVYTNSAGLARLNQLQVQGMSFKAFEANYYSIESSIPMGEFVLGFGIIQSAVDGIQETAIVDNLVVDQGNSFSYKGTAAFVAAGYNISDSLSLGITGKYIIEKLYNNSSKGYGVDVGILYDLPLKKLPLTLGASIKNLIEPKLVWDTGTYTAIMERHYDLGAALKLMDNKLIISSDYKLKKSNSTLHFGLEYALLETIPFRFGYDDQQLSFGVGLNLDSVYIDYSLTLPKSQYKEFLENVSKINVGIKL